MHRRLTALLVAAAAAVPAALPAQETVQSGRPASLTQASVIIWNASGSVRLRRGTGNAITVTATAQGPDGDQLRFETDTDGSRGRFRVVYPDVDAIASPDGRGGYGNSDLDLFPDGTFGGDEWRGSRNRGRRDRIRIGGSRGFRGWADIEISVPEGKSLVVHLAVGRVTADGVSGDVTIDTYAASAEGTNLAGDWLFDTGSGDVTVRGLRGSLKIDTGSGTGMATDVVGDALDIDTGSGNVEVTNARVDRFNFDTGSGDVVARGITARRGLVDTGSGRVNLAYTGGTIDDLTIDTGSGSVNLTLPPDANARVIIDSGSGEAVVQRAGAMLERRGDEGTVLTFGAGRGRIAIDTGSGSVTIR